jgi:hypothetical protein
MNIIARSNSGRNLDDTRLLKDINQSRRTSNWILISCTHSRSTMLSPVLIRDILSNSKRAHESRCYSTVQRTEYTVLPQEEHYSIKTSDLAL